MENYHEVVSDDILRMENTAWITIYTRVVKNSMSRDTGGGRTYSAPELIQYGKVEQLTEQHYGDPL